MKSHHRLVSRSGAKCIATFVSNGRGRFWVGVSDIKSQEVVFLKVPVLARQMQNALDVLECTDAGKSQAIDDESIANPFDIPPPDECRIMGKANVVYFFQAATDDGPIKIGSAICALKRLKDIQAFSPVKLRCLGVYPGDVSDEKTIHRHFKKDRLHGEWFSPTPELIDFIERNCQCL